MKCRGMSTRERANGSGTMEWWCSQLVASKSMHTFTKRWLIYVFGFDNKSLHWEGDCQLKRPSSKRTWDSKLWSSDTIFRHQILICHGIKLLESDLKANEAFKLWLACWRYTLFPQNSSGLLRSLQLACRYFLTNVSIVGTKAVPILVTDLVATCSFQEVCMQSSPDTNSWSPVGNAPLTYG